MSRFAAVKTQVQDRVPWSSGIHQQGDYWVVWWDDADGRRHTSTPMPYPLARETLTEWRRRAVLAEGNGSRLSGP